MCKTSVDCCKERNSLRLPVYSDKMDSRKFLLALVTFVCLAGARCAKANTGKTYPITIRMDKAVSSRPDDLECTAVELDPEEAYIIQVDPHASMKTAHHMMVYGCVDLPTKDSVWDCHDADIGDSENSVCRGGRREILFAWARDAPGKSLPEGVGIRVSGTTGIKYIVVQLHYASMFPEGVTDDSGVTLTMTRHRPPQQAGYLVMANYGFIPPRQEAFHVESYCDYERSYPIYPIAFRTHAHWLGYVISAYRVRDGEWMEIGRMSPQLPQTFYPVSHPGMEIKRGDKLASRCTMNSMDREDNTHIGPTQHEEMCNFYIMYSTYYEGDIKNEYCFLSIQNYHWADNFAESTFPDDASSLRGIPGVEEVLDHFHMKEVV